MTPCLATPLLQLLIVLCQSKLVLADKAALDDLPEDLRANHEKEEDTIPASSIRRMWELKRKEIITGEDLQFTCEVPLTPFRVSTLSISDERQLMELFLSLYGEGVISRISPCIKECKRILLSNEVIAANKRSSDNPYSCVLARHPGTAELVPAIVQSLYCVRMIMEGGDVNEHFIAKVKWLKENENRFIFGVNSRLELWSTDLSDSFPYIPTKFISGRFVKVHGRDIEVTNGTRFRMVDRPYIVIPLPTRSMNS